MTTTDETNTETESQILEAAAKEPKCEQNFKNPNYRRLKDSLSFKTSVPNDESKIPVLDVIQRESDQQKTSLFERCKNLKKQDENKDKELEQEEEDDDYDVSKLNQELERIESKLRKETVEKSLPQDWERYEDDQGPYYWHVPSGTIQRDAPTAENDAELDKRQSIIYYEEEEDDDLNDLQMNGKDSSLLLDSTFGNRRAPPNGFVVHALGSLPFDVTQLTPELSSKAIQRCIIELSTKSDGALRVWGKQGGKRLRLRIERACLKLCDESSGHVLHLQPLGSIRVWGVNANNDFAYVAADNDRPDSPVNASAKKSDSHKRLSRTALDEEAGGGGSGDAELDEEGQSALLQPEADLVATTSKEPPLRCHIFHCQERLEANEPIVSDSMPEASQIAALLKAEMLRFKREQNTENGFNPIIEEYSSSAESTPSFEFALSPSPAEQQPRKTVIGNYLGAINVDLPSGVDMLNEAIERVCGQRNTPIVCLLHVCPSVISVENTNSAQTLFECRVRYLSFMGISKVDSKYCAFVQQRSERNFVAHVFECRPNAVLLCQAIEQACKARFQKCMDAHRLRCGARMIGAGVTRGHGGQAGASGTRRGIKGTIQTVFSKLLSK